MIIKRILTLTLCVVALAAASQVSSQVSSQSDGAAAASDEDVTLNVGAPRLSAAFLPDSVGIGDHVTLAIDVEQDMMQVVAFPEFNLDGEMPLELVGKPQLDTVAVEGRRVKLRRRYTFTSFEEGYYNLGRVSILYADRNGTDTLHSDQELLLTVGTFLIDSTSHSIFDLKPVRTLPFKFGEISGYVSWSIVALILLLIVAYFALRLLAHYGRPVMGMFKPKPPLPPHVAAFKALDSLRQERLWQDGDYKSYYSKLTDILRTYISGRYGITAMEMTSEEIIASVRDLELPRQCEMELRDLLRDADLVKFAKAEIEASQNERYFESARLFVDKTKLIVEVDDAEAAADAESAADSVESVASEASEGRVAESDVEQVSENKES